MNMIVRGLFLVAVLCAPGISHAATLYFNPQETEIFPGDTKTLAVRLDTDEGECVNVIDGVITYPENVIAVDVSRGESILPVWVEEPVINTDKRQITFAGGIPNGYCGRIEGDPGLTNVVLEVVFQAPGIRVEDGEEDPVAEIIFDPSTRVYLNDGQGTEADLRAFGGSMYVHDEPGGEVVNEWNPRVDADTVPPNEFSISLEQDSSIFGGKYFIVFNTTDKQSGLDHYEVIEESTGSLDLFLFGSANAPWVTAKSPYQLEDQSLNSTIRVKAVDKAGNEYIATLVPDESLRGPSQREHITLGLSIAGALILMMLVGAFFVYRRSGRSPLEKQDTDGGANDSNDAQARDGAEVQGDNIKSDYDRA